MPEVRGSQGLLHILFDGTWWIEGPIANAQSQKEFILAWARLFPQDSLIVAVPKVDAEKAAQELRGIARVVPTRLRPHGISVIVELSALAGKLRPDITISHNFTPWFGRSAVFVADLLFVTDPDWFTPLERAYFSLMSATVGRADIVFTGTATEAARNARVSSAKSAIPVGLGLSTLVEDAEPVEPGGLGELDGFVLTVGRLNVRKNLVGTIRGAIGSGVLSPRRPLLIVGEASGRAEDLPESMRHAIEDGSVRFLGRVSDDELRWLYLHATVFAFLTLDEGFGMPLLEALSMNTPMLISDIPVFREIVGDRARRVDPRDDEAIAVAMRELVTDPQPPRDAESVLEYYTWENAARRMRAAVVEKMA